PRVLLVGPRPLGRGPPLARRARARPPCARDDGRQALRRDRAPARAGSRLGRGPPAAEDRARDARRARAVALHGIFVRSSVAFQMSVRSISPRIHGLSCSRSPEYHAVTKRPPPSGAIPA